MRKAVIGLGLCLVAACAESPEKGDSESGRPAPGGDENVSGGSRAERGGSTSSGGATSAGTATGATSTGGSASGGTAQGGATQGGNANPGGSGGSGAEAAGEGGASDGAAGGSAAGGANTSGSGGRSGVSGSGGSSDVDPTCDPVSGELDSTPYPVCQPRDANDRCEQCIEANCCEAARTCYGYEPANVCGWGGPMSGPYAGLNEIDCFVACVKDFVEENGAYGDAADDRCIPRCTTEMCGLIGNATLGLVACLRASCQDDCYEP